MNKLLPSVLSLALVATLCQPAEAGVLRKCFLVSKCIVLTPFRAVKGAAIGTFVYVAGGVYQTLLEIDEDY